MKRNKKRRSRRGQVDAVRHCSATAAPQRARQSEGSDTPVIHAQPVVMHIFSLRDSHCCRRRRCPARCIFFFLKRFSASLHHVQNASKNVTVSYQTSAFLFNTEFWSKVSSCRCVRGLQPSASSGAASDRKAAACPCPCPLSLRLRGQGLLKGAWSLRCH